MKPLLLGTGLAVALGSASFAAPAPPQTMKIEAVSAPSKKSTTARTRREPGKIACTVAGCHEIPPGCQPQMGYNWDGIPTGFDIVVCPPYRGRGG